MSTQTNPHEDLAYIRDLMEDTRRAAGLSGGYFVLWGLAISVGLLLTWLQVIDVLPYRPILTWGPCLALGLLGHFVLAWRDEQRPVQSRAGRLVGTVWLALGVAQLIYFVASMGFNTLPGIYMPGVVSSLLGSGIFITGVLAGITWLRNVGVAWWLGAISMFAWPGDHVSLLMGVLLLIFYVVPGVVLIRQQRAPVASGV